ncbi:MAG: hypothetical protein ABRQ38_10185 [Candidatus Eremiobacterota bacterium]
MNGKKVKLEYKLKQGDVSKYKTLVESSTEITEEGQTKSISSVMEMMTTQTISSVFPDGSMKVEVSIDSASLTRDGEEIPVPSVGQTIPMKMKKNGEVSQLGAGGAGSGQTHASFPENQVGIGENWSGESTIEIPGTDKTVVLKTNHTLEAFEKMKNHECSKINVSTPETTIPLQEDVTQTILVTGTTYFDHNEGRLVKSIAETKTWMTLPTGQSVNTLTKMIIEIEGEKKVESKGPAVSLDFGMGGGFMPSI